MTDTDIYSLDSFSHQVYVDEDDPILERLAEFRCALFYNGYEPVSVRGKGCLNIGWTSGAITIGRIVRETLSGTGKLNTGLRCGRVAVVDNDLRDPEHAAAADEIVAHMLGPTPLKRRGSKGACLCYRNNTPIPKLAITAVDGTRLFEVLGTGQQFVAYGMHPAGMDYTWIGDGEPATVPISELPEVTPEQLGELHATIRELLIELGYVLEKPKELRPETPKSAAKTHHNSDENITELCRAAAAVLNNDYNREDWVKMCYAFHDAGLDYRDWEEFSNTWGRGHKPGEIGRVWNSCSNPSSVTYRTLLEEADKADPEWRSRYYAPHREQRCRDRDQWIEHQYQDFRRQQEAEAEWDCEGEEIKIGEQCFPDRKDDEGPGKKEPLRNRRTWCYFDEYLDLPDRRYWDENGEHGFLIYLPGGSIMLVTGRWGSHKTNIISKMVLDAVFDKGARALYIACEGQFLYGRERMPEFCKARGIDVTDLRGRFHFGDAGIVLTDKQSVAQVIDDNREFMPNIVIIDTLTQATPGIDSNNKEMGDILGNTGPVAAIKKAFNALVIVLVHPPKSAKISDAADISGHGSIVGNTDTLAVTRYDKNNRIVTLTMERNKNGPEDLQIWFNIPEFGFPVPEKLMEDPFVGQDEVKQKGDYHQEQASIIRGICILKVADPSDWDSMITNNLMAQFLWDKEWEHPQCPKSGIDQESWIKAKEKELGNIQTRKLQDRSPYSGLVYSQGRGKLTFRRWGYGGEVGRQ